MSEADRALKSGCLGMAARIVVIRLAAVGVVFVIGMISVFFGLIVGMLTEAVWGIVAAAGSFFLIAFGGGYLFLIGAVLRRKMLLDKAFLPLGLKGAAYRLMFRRYIGSVRGRNTEVYFYRGPILEVLIPTSLRTRAGITLDYSDTSALAGVFGEKAVDHRVRGMEDVRVWSEDETWVKQLLMDPQVAKDLRSLLSERAFFVRSVVKIFPGYVHLHLSGNQNVLRWSIPPELAHKWVMSLLDFAEHAETRVPKPGVVVEMSSAEDLALKIKRKDTSRLTVYFALGLLGFFVIVTFVVAIFVAILANLGP